MGKKQNAEQRLEVFGEGFIGHAPNGDTYKFNLAYIIYTPKMGDVGSAPFEKNVYILAAIEVKDVNDNWVKHTCDANKRLKKISSNDDLIIDINYAGTE